MTLKLIPWGCIAILFTSLTCSQYSWSASNQNYEDRIESLEREIKRLSKKSSRNSKSINKKFKKSRERMKFYGFISAGLSRSNEETNHVIGVSNINNYPLDSIIGFQVNARVNDKTEAVLQLVGRGSEQNEIVAEWAYLSYAFTPKTSIKAGRLRVPFYSASEYIEVGYAYPWVRPPVDVYSLIPITAYYGLDLTTEFSALGWDGTFQLFTGTDVLKFENVGISVPMKNMLGANLNIERGNFSFHLATAGVELRSEGSPILLPSAEVAASSAYTTFTTDFALFIGGLDDADVFGAFLGNQLWESNQDQFGTNEAAGTLAAASFLGQTSTDGKIIDLQSVGMIYDDGKRIARLEAIKFLMPGEFVDVHANYITVGHRIKKILPFFQYSHTYTTGAGIIAASVGQLMPAIAKAIGYTHRAQQTITAGTRWDIHRGLAAKFQIEHMYGFQGTRGLFESSPSTNPNLYSISIDSVF